MPRNNFGAFFIIRCITFDPNKLGVSLLMKRFLLILIFFVGLLATTFSQDSIAKKNIRKQKKSFLLTNKSWTAEVPLWLPGFAGSFAYGDIDIEGEDGVDPEQPIEPPPPWDPGGILSRLFTSDWYFKFFFITRIAYEKNNFLFAMDGLSGSIGNSLKFKHNNKEIVQVNFRSSNVRFIGGYKLVQADSRNKKFRYELFGYIGVRMYLQEIYSDLNGAINKLDFHPFWFEPLIGVQNQFTFKRWLIILQADYGGYFINDRFSVQFSGFAYYRTGKTTSLKLGWNHLQLYHKGTFMKEDYTIKTTFSGPTVGVAFHF